MAVKKTPEIIPLCHPVPITSVKTEFELGADSLTARCRVTADYRTGVEMEALAGVAAALLTIWDMVKYMEKDEKGQYPLTSITDVKVVEKRKER
jgi:cyclic pyranopterin phosphate synthase